MRNLTLVFLAAALAPGQTAPVGTVQVGSFTGTARFGRVPREIVITKRMTREEAHERRR